MAIAKKALVWSLFAAGGTLTAILFPALIALFLLVSLGFLPVGLGYPEMSRFTSSWTGKLILFGILFFSLWHAAHRMRVIFHDLGIRADAAIALGLYFVAALGTVMAVFYLWPVQ